MSSYKNPNVPLIENPVNLDKAIQGLQITLANGLSWLEKSYGRAFLGSEKKANKNYLYPEVYTGKGEYLNVMPNDNLKSQVFFEVYDPVNIFEQGEERQQFSYERYHSFRYDIALVFWFNLKRIEGGYNYRYTEILKQDVLRVIKTESSFNPKTIYEEPEQVFKRYDLYEDIYIYFKQPFAGFKIVGELVFDDDLCSPPITQTYLSNYSSTFIYSQLTEQQKTELAALLQ